MEFQVSARKWRPQKFSELIGQEHIVQTLTHAIELDRLSHAYLFSGTRGVGKTTTARILAKVLNCEKGPTIEPCDVCDFCREIRQGSSIDVQEIDGASNNGVAEVRDIIDKVQYAAAACRFKVYIIDEVHMLSKSAFNALLKTLEEPPPGVVFIFATTELNKIPETILSRCQCFEFKPLSRKQIIRQLEIICKHDGIQIEAPDLETVAGAGAGSMRDAQSLLDQVIAYAGKSVTAGSVQEVLGTVGSEALAAFVDHLIARDPGALLTRIQELVNQGKDLNFFCRDLAAYLRNLLIVKLTRDPAPLLDSQTCDLEVLKPQAEKLEADELQQMFSALSKAELEMKRSSLAQIVFEMAVMRLNDVRPFRQIDELIRRINEMEPDAAVENISPGAQKKTVDTLPSGQTALEGPAAPSTQSTPPSAEGSDWAKVQREIRSSKPFMGHYLNDCAVSLSKTSIHLGLPSVNILALVDKPENLRAIQDAVKTVLGNSVDVKLSLVEEGEAKAPGDSRQEKKKQKDYNKPSQIAESEIIREALDIFGGVVIR